MMRAESSGRRVLFLTNTMGTGGVGNQLYNISTRLRERGYEIKILSLCPLGRFGKQTVESGIDVKSLEFKNKLWGPIALYRIRRAIQSFGPDIIHTHLFHATILGRIASIGTHTAVITTVHNTYDKNPEQYTKTIRDHLYRLTDPLVDLTTFVSDAAHDRYVRVGTTPENKSHTIYNGIDVEEFQPEQVRTGDEDEFLWITVGNLQEQKDHHTLLEAVAQIEETRDDFRVQIVGEGELREELEVTANDLGVTDIVDFEGRVESVPKYLNAADAFVLSSRWEGFGLVVAEAMACELPVVATNTGGPSEIVKDGETGFLAQKGSPQDLADKMQKLINLSPEERAAFGSRGRQRIKENYSIERTVSKWEDIYERYDDLSV